MSNLERLKQRLQESLEKHKNRLLRTRYKKANGLTEGKSTKSTSYTTEEPKKSDTTKNDMANSGSTKRATIGRDKNPSIYDGHNLKGRLNARLGSGQVPQVRGEKESNTLHSRPLKDRLNCKANLSTGVIRASTGTCFREGNTNRDVAKGVIPDHRAAKHAVDVEDTIQQHNREHGNFDGVSNEIRDNLNDLFRHFVNCKINNLYVIHGDRGKLPRAELADEGPGVMMIPEVAATEQVQEGLTGELLGEKQELHLAFPDADEVRCDNHTRAAEQEGLHSRVCHVQDVQSHVHDEGGTNGVSGDEDTRKETKLIGGNVAREDTSSGIMADGTVTRSSELVGAGVGSGRYNSTFVKLMEIKKKIKNKIKNFEDEDKRMFCTDERTLCNSDSSNEQRSLPVRDVSTFTDGNVASSAKGFNHWGVVHVDSSVASCASSNHAVSSKGDSIELFTTQKNIFVCNYYTKKSGRTKGRHRDRRHAGIHVLSDAANFLGSAFSLASHSTATCDVGWGELEQNQSGKCQSNKYETHFNPQQSNAARTYLHENKGAALRRSSTQGRKVLKRTGSPVNMIPDQWKERPPRSRDKHGNTKYEFSSCPSSSCSYQSNCLYPSRGNGFKCSKGQVRRGISKHMEKQANGGWSLARETHATWDTPDRGTEPHYTSVIRSLGRKQSATCMQDRSKYEMKNAMQCEINMCNERSGECKDEANRFAMWGRPTEEQVPWTDANVQATSPVQWKQCSGDFSLETGEHCFVELNRQRSRLGDDPRARAPLKVNRTNHSATPPQLSPSAHQSCEKQAKCYICSFPIRNSEEKFILKKKKKDYHVVRMEQEDTSYKQNECTPKNCFSKTDSLYPRHRCSVSSLVPEEHIHRGMLPGDMLAHKESTHHEKHKFLSRQSIHAGSATCSYMLDQQGEAKQMETPAGHIDIKHKGVQVHPGQHNGHGHRTNLRYHSVKEQEKEHEPDEPSFVMHSNEPTYGCKLQGEASHKREEAIWDGGPGGFPLQTSVQEEGLQRNTPICAVKRHDGLNNARRINQWSHNPLRVPPHERSCSRQEPSPARVATPRDMDHVSDAYNTWVYKERVSASAAPDMVSIESVVVNGSTRAKKPKTLFWKISEGDTFTIPVEEDSGKILQLRGLLDEGPAKEHQGFGTEGGTNRRRVASNGAILKKVLRMKMEAMRKEQGHMEPRNVTPPVGPTKVEHNAHNVSHEDRNRLSKYEKGGTHTHGEATRMHSGHGEAWVRDKLSGRMGGADGCGGSTGSRETLSRGTLNGGTRNGDRPIRLPPCSRVEREPPREMTPRVGSMHVEASPVPSASTLERIPSSVNTLKMYSLSSGLTRNAPVTLKRVGTVGPDDDEDKKGEDIMEVQRFNESYYCNMKRIKGDDVYPNSEEPISTSQKRRLMKAYLEDLRKKKQNKQLFNYKLKYNIEFFKFAQFICQDKNFCSNYLGQMGSNMVSNGDDIDRIAFSIVKLFNAR
ncbi:hypothetical protein AK88_04152 [Plasmodium fragile]|uniref:Uncharacterized protein n=1 Tax=Plasmodium fragile TaxID=5857 RepID=A0A0D9QKE3_PLAFR|nr:uncharacterized protein AK88_04152 [Plasmodium fragile]KJP86181.1 hypothetical protein AK88_04152 [Plasmodium fragile]